MEYEVYPRTTRTEVAPKGAFPFLEENMRRPINPVIPYPNEAIQHTRCVLALSMITVAISFLKPETLALLGDLGKQVEKVNRWSERCADDTQKRRLSAGAKRDKVDPQIAEIGTRVYERAA